MFWSTLCLMIIIMTRAQTVWLEENNNNVEQFEQGNQIIPPDFQTIKLELLSRTKLFSKER